VLLHDDAANEVKLHDVLEVLGILDPMRHCDEAVSEADSFDELLEQENAGHDNENTTGGGAVHADKVSWHQGWSSVPHVALFAVPAGPTVCNTVLLDQAQLSHTSCDSLLCSAPQCTDCLQLAICWMRLLRAG
jgi:hypothetical protein